MPLIYTLCSSSKGNSTFVGGRDGGVLIDAGLSVRQFFRQMALADIPPAAVRAIFITHEHSDHVKGLYSISECLRVPIYASRETLEYLIQREMIPPGGTACEIRRKTAAFGEIQVSAFTTPHDSAHSLGYRLEFAGGKAACVCTDLGHMTEDIYSRLSGSDFVLLESNYDEELLENGSYPRFLKKRIFSDLGHLSNRDCADTLLRLFNNGTTRFALGHLSEQNNRPELAFSASLGPLSQAGAILNEDYILTVAKPNGMGEVLEF